MNHRQPLDTLREQLSGHADPDEAQGAERTFRRLLHAIVSLELRPGALVSERDMMEASGATRASLRPAVVRLSELGLVRTLPRKGLVVASLDTLDAQRIYEARWAVEGRVARLAAMRATDEEITALDDLAAEPVADESDGREAWRSFLEHDQALHLSIAATAKNRYLYDALTRILPLASRLWHWAYGELGVDQQVRFGHHVLVDAIRAHDPDAAEDAVLSHVEQAQGMLREVFIGTFGGGQ